ncbi:hypothetical protein HK098_002492 [Nowakowskiella sp. JEL0407]|nr:hypothetical protein HK098_002492 [Nowakowskiella sp. JEL0407]
MKLQGRSALLTVAIVVSVLTHYHYVAKSPDVMLDRISRVKRWESLTIKLLSENSTTNQCDPNRIPKIIHQTWKSNNIPELYCEWVNSWKTLNTNFDYKLWTDVDNRNLVKKHFPWFLPTYDNLPREINRVDAVRNCYIYLYGGIYIDLDLEAVRPMEEFYRHIQFIPSRKIFANGNGEVSKSLNLNDTTTFESPNIDIILPLLSSNLKFPHNIPNAWMASRPGHPFWILALDMIMGRSQRFPMWYLKWFKNVEWLTGPIALYDVVTVWNELVERYGFSDLHFTPPGVIFPYDWNSMRQSHKEYCSAEVATFNPHKCKKLVLKPYSFAISYWSHSWGSESYKLWQRLFRKLNAVNRM